MGGAVSGVAGPNWMLIGDAAACVNPLNGEGIDYGLETGRLAAELLGDGDLTEAWPAELRRHYGRGFSVARRLALLLTIPRFLPATGPVAMRSEFLMGIAVRVMGNLVTDEDADWVARLVAPCRRRFAPHRPPQAVQLIPTPHAGICSTAADGRGDAMTWSGSFPGTRRSTARRVCDVHFPKDWHNPRTTWSSDRAGPFRCVFVFAISPEKEIISRSLGGHRGNPKISKPVPTPSIDIAGRNGP